MAKTKEDQQVDQVLDGFEGRWRVGQAYFFRLITYHILGRVTKVDKNDSGTMIFLEQASWIPDSGRFADFVSGKIQANEIEPVGNWFINEAAITDGCLWKNQLPTQQK